VAEAIEDTAPVRRTTLGRTGVCPTCNGRAIRSLRPTEAVLIEDKGHLPMLEAPEYAARLIQALLAGVDA
jgi:pimeloyl-ACP methyl ester carboxylesterase